MGNIIPRVSDHFFELKINSEHFLLDWYITLFSKPLDIFCLSRVWDHIFLEGEIFIHRTAIAILQSFEEEILSLRSLDGCLNFLHNVPKVIPTSKNLPQDRRK